MPDEATTYDQVPYPGQPYRHTHPDRMASIATLFGLEPADSARCRVLELGCGDGSNLIPMAYQLPESEFIGIDLAANAIAKGQDVVTALGLRNITLRQMDLLAFPSEMGPFDYIVAHGLYSWVPPAVRDKVLAICGSQLAPHGVAFVSYNTYPAGHLRTMMREMMLFHAGRSGDPGERMAQAEAFLAFLVESRTETSAYGTLLQEELTRIRQYDRAAWFHDDLSDINQPVYFHDFVERARAFGLQYLADAVSGPTEDHRLGAGARAWLAEHVGEDRRVEREQIADFLLCRGFRRTLLCREERALRTPVPSQVSQFHLAGSFVPIAPASGAPPDETMAFSTPAGIRISTDGALQKAALAVLGERWPEAIRFDDLLASVLDRAAVGMDVEDRAGARSALCELLWKGYAAGIADLRLHAPRLVRTPSEYPEASAVARLQLRSQTTVTSLLHSSLWMDEAPRQLLVLLDGTRTRAALLEELKRLTAAANPPAQGDGAEVPESDGIRDQLAVLLDEQLSQLGRAALLVR